MHPHAGIAELVRAAERITVLSGAGMSAESGVPTFRDAQSGLWERFDPEQLVTPEAFAEDPELVWAWYLWRVRLVRSVEPNAGHLALAEMARWRDVRIVTQNVDDLHERAGSPVLAHVHGSLTAFRCAACAEPQALPQIPCEIPLRLAPPRCDNCGGQVRPGVVWFGELLPDEPYAQAVKACEETDLLLAVGTSGLVWPAAGLAWIARSRGIPCVEINPVETNLSSQMTTCWRTTAARGLPALADLVR